MDLQAFKEEFEEFVEEKDFLRIDDGDPDEYRKGYRAGYWDAIAYVQGWLEEAEGMD